MFLNQLKDFSTKKIVKNNLRDPAPAPSENLIQTVGILFDETNFRDREALMAELSQNGINRGKIEILVFKDRIKSNEEFDYPVFSHKDFSWTATIDKLQVKNFIAKRFDLLINYYDIEKAPLLLVSHLSKADFKVGFSSIDKRLNHFMIDTEVGKYKIFTDELFKYLKILNKI